MAVTKKPLRRLLFFRKSKRFKSSQKTWIYAELESARRPLPHSEDVHVPQFCHFSDESPESDFLHDASISSSEVMKVFLKKALLKHRSSVRRN